MREYGFELDVCAFLEARRGGVVSRQLGGAVAAPGARVMDAVHVAPGPEFDARTRLTTETIPTPLLEADIGVGRWEPVTDAVPGTPERARRVAEHGAAIGVVERERRDGRTVIRQVAPYPDWFGSLTGIENKPDLGSPGALRHQVRMDVALGVFDRVVVATASHVTGAHLNRLPDAVGVWEFDPDDRRRTVVREPAPLNVDGAGIEIREEHALRTDIAVLDREEKARARRRIAERAYGKGWRPDRYPACHNCSVTDVGLPFCTFFDRVVDPGVECGTDCPGYDRGPRPDVDVAAMRDDRSDWEADPPTLTREQASLTRFEE